MLATQCGRKKIKMRATSYLLREWCWTLRRTLPLFKEAYHSCLSNTVFPLRYKIVFLLRLSLIWWMTSWTCLYQSNLSSTLPSFSQSSCSPAKIKLTKLFSFLPSLPLLYGHLFDAGMVAMFLWCPYRVQMIVTRVNCALNFCMDMELHQSLKPVQGTRLEEQSYASLITANYIQVLK